MKIQNNYLLNKQWFYAFNEELDSEQTVLMVFSQLSMDDIQPYIDQLSKVYPLSKICGCSTAGQILNSTLINCSVLVVVTQFEKSKIELNCVVIEDADQSFEKGMELASIVVDKKQLNNLIVLSKGLNINGSQLIDGMNARVDSSVLISGGLAGDDHRFQSTWVIDSQKQAQTNCVSVLAIYGKHINSRSASKGGWDMIGMDRLVTRSSNNVLFELDNKPALDVYKKYLGEYANDLPSSGLLFPLAIVDKNNSKVHKVRTILAVNHDQKSITFAGDVPKNSTVRLMHANFDRLIDGAGEAANDLMHGIQNITQESLCLSISCVGRKLILGQRIDEELEAVQSFLPDQCTQAGFYSYGEISPLMNGACDLHNQTMTLTLLWEN